MCAHKRHERSRKRVCTAKMVLDLFLRKRYETYVGLDRKYDGLYRYPVKIRRSRRFYTLGKSFTKIVRSNAFVRCDACARIPLVAYRRYSRTNIAVGMDDGARWYLRSWRAYQSIRRLPFPDSSGFQQRLLGCEYRARG